jgi:hypothetical protein
MTKTSDETVSARSDEDNESYSRIKNIQWDNNMSFLESMLGNEVATRLQRQAVNVRSLIRIKMADAADIAQVTY